MHHLTATLRNGDVEKKYIELQIEKNFFCLSTVTWRTIGQELFATWIEENLFAFKSLITLQSHFGQWQIWKMIFRKLNKRRKKHFFH